MPVSVLVVDDSSFFQHRLAEIINGHPQLNVCGFASNGREAIEMTQRKQPDVITMDYEMPLMDGLTALREIMSSRPTPIIMFSSLTYEGAQVTLDALDAGAVDFLPKNFAEVSKQTAGLKKKLHNRLLALAKPARSMGYAPANPNTANTPKLKGTVHPIKPSTTEYKKKPAQSPLAETHRYPPARQSLLGRTKILAIGASTGGPIALLEVLKNLPINFPVPILLIQHMPENFTRAFAERLNSQCNIRVHLAEDGMSLAPGNAYLAPGGQQMLIDSKDRNKIKVLPSDDRLNYKPSVDITFASAAISYQSAFLAMVLTGMGSDGCQGCEVVKQHDGLVWSQDQRSSVIYGMPMAVAKANLSDRVIALNDISQALTDAFNC